MARKKSADQQPFVSEGAAAAPAPARNPRSNAVTHKHKKATPVAQPAEGTPVEEAVEMKRPTTATPSHEEIAMRAYFYWESRGFQGGSPEDDWFRAERELLSR
jgi:hypothetical protein